MVSEYMNLIRGFQNEAPVPVVTLAKSLGIKVFKNDGFPNNLSGLIKLDGENTYSIHVNGNHPHTRQRFTIAHEIAHFILHRDKIGDGIKDDYLYRSGMTTAEEREANRLAAEILMPEHLMLAEENRTLRLSVLADKFDVSPMTMDIRRGEIL